MQAYEKVLSAVSAYRPRPGQKAMAQAVARTFARAQLGPADEGVAPTREIAVVQAGTGVGKSAGYLIPGIAIAKALGTRLVVVTSTVALQEQIVGKDLPMIADALGEPVKFVLAKGRSRYLCIQKLLRSAELHDEQDFLDLDDEARDTTAPVAHDRVSFYRGLTEALSNASWDGEVDTLPEPPPQGAWSQVSADRFSCTAKACPSYKTCPYFSARRKLAEADVIVVNHDLLLSSLGTRSLPELDDCLIAFDEGHHLPQKAVEQFETELDLTRVRWIDRAGKQLASCAAELGSPVPLQDSGHVLSVLKAAHADMARILLDTYASGLQDRAYVRRMRDGEIDAAVAEPLRALKAAALELLSCCRALGDAARERIKLDGIATPRIATVYATLGGIADRCANAEAACRLLLSHGDDAAVTAKWMAVDTSHKLLAVSLHACPVLPGPLLAANVWAKTRAAVITSATLTSCGDFDYFLSEAGLKDDPSVSTQVVASPFDYARQGRLVVRSTRSSARNLAAYNAEVAQLLAKDIARATAGGLALFTSRRHLEQAVAAVPPEVQDRLLVQGSMSRARLLAEHRRRVANGRPSILMGLQQFGEGLDLPGDLCRHLWIAKLPFNTPTDPVSEVRAEYVLACGGNPFAELVVPAAGVRLLQWTGRGIRTETDTAIITVFDQRLVDKEFGRRILKGLPPYPVERARALAT